jgi:ribosomal protein S18 acetylase RimI-like enzyme
MESDDVVACELAIFRAWPAAEAVEHDGWIFRHGDGFSRRLNSVTVMPGAADDAMRERLAAASRWLSERGVPPLVRVTSASPPTVDADLHALGYRCEAETIVMSGALDREAESAGTIGERPSPQWLACAAAWLGIADVAAWQRVLTRVTPPVAYALRQRDGRPVSVGLGVVRGSWLGIFEVATDPALRRQGHAGLLVGGLVRWARAQGARRGVLQVVADNTPAIGLYESLGFAEAYRYWYRRPHLRPPSTG